MDYVVICSVAVFTSALTLFSGFGVGTLLTPAFILFFPPEIAVGMTAIVHFSNNLFKLVLMGKHADRQAVLLFGLPAIVTAFLGAELLVRLSEIAPLATYELNGQTHEILPIKLIIAAMMIVFALAEILPALKRLALNRKHLPIGGALSGFFGGLSGHQGALRSAFLLKCGLSKESFIGTGVVISCMVDAMRIVVYAGAVLAAKKANPLEGRSGWLVLAACLAAFLGAFIGKKLLKKVTIRTVQWIVAVMLFGIALGLGSGLI